MDRLLLNNGKGALEAASSEALPELKFSGGPAVAADFDHDGDLDLFIGGRINPGAYPTSPRSALLRNDSTPGSPKFVDVTETIAPELMNPGMVTSALWTDVDNDGWLDLLLTLDWGPITFFKNEAGAALTNHTDSTGIANQLGWFNSISSGDLDHDGDIDYVVGNFGRNTKYRPSKESPSRIYYGDFDESGKGQIVEAKVKKGTLLPVRGKSCSQNAMPFIRKKFPTYKDFASQGLIDIYPEDKLANSLTLEANNLDSAVLINEGAGKFSFKPLPAIAQAAPVFGSAITDFNGDTHMDIAIAQNFYGPQRETGRFDGGLSLILLGDGKGGFEALWPNVSGVSVKADATALVVADFNLDQRPDIAIASNNGPTYSFINQSDDTTFRSLKLKGPKGNPTAVGARIKVHFNNGQSQTIEVTCGGGYLSQSSATHFIGHPKDVAIKSIDTHWPDGTRQSTTSLPSGPLTISSKEP